MAGDPNPRRAASFGALIGPFMLIPMAPASDDDRRESPGVIRELLEDARGEGFLLVLDIQPGRSPIGEELEYLRPFLSEPDVHLALDPEFDMSEGQVPARGAQPLR